MPINRIHFNMPCQSRTHEHMHICNCMVVCVRACAFMVAFYTRSSFFRLHVFYARDVPILHGGIHEMRTHTILMAIATRIFAHICNQIPYVNVVCGDWRVYTMHIKAYMLCDFFFQINSIHYFRLLARIFYTGYDHKNKK